MKSLTPKELKPYFLSLALTILPPVASQSVNDNMPPNSEKPTQETSLDTHTYGAVMQDSQTDNTTFHEVGTSEINAQSATTLLCSVQGMQFYTDTSFTPLQRQILTKACRKAYYRFDRDKVIDCAMTKAKTYRAPTAGKLKDKSYRQTLICYAAGMKETSNKVYILEARGLSNTLGIAWLNITEVGNVGKRFYIGINADYMNSAYTNGTNYHLWSGVVAHEMLHNMGYSHPDDNDAGTLILEWDNCIQKDRSGSFGDNGQVGPGRNPSSTSPLKPMPKNY